MEKALILLLNNLVKNKNYQIKLVLEKKEGCLLEELNSEITVEEYALSTNKNKIIRKISNFSKRVLWNIKNYRKYDFSCNYATYSVIGSRLAQVASKNNALYVHSNYYEALHHKKNKVEDFFSKHRLQYYRHIICVSNECARGIKTVFPSLEEKIVVINNLFDSNNVIKKSKEKVDTALFQPQNINFIFVGRLENESKNLDLLLESFYMIIQKNSAYHLFIVGDGPYKGNVQKFISIHKVGKNIHLLGEKNNPYPYMSKSDCLILTSNYEGFPVVYLEAITLDLPIMTTVPTSDDVIDIRNECIFILKDKEDILKKVLEFKKENFHYNYNFEIINKKRIESLRQIIEVDL